MACFSDLPFELQTEIWTLVLPYRGGVQWIEFEGFPHPAHVINKTLEWSHKLYNDRTPNAETSEYNYARYDNNEYDQHCRDLDQSSEYFQYLYQIVPSIWGHSKGPQEDTLKSKMLDEIAATRRCRQLSTYSQVATLLSVSQTSRLVALDYLEKMNPDLAWPLFRGAGAIYRPRPLEIWRKQYKATDTSLKGAKGILPGICGLFNHLENMISRKSLHFFSGAGIRNKSHYMETRRQQYKNNEIVLEEAERIVPRICGALDLVVFRLHNTLGHPKDTLSFWRQMRPCINTQPVLAPFDRIGIEWHPLWATTEGRKYLCEDKIVEIVGLGRMNGFNTKQLYWLVDGVPRPQWNQYPPAIPAAFSRIIEKRKEYILHHWRLNKAIQAQLLEHHDLYQEFEANGRRYYVVFVATRWNDDEFLEESFRDPGVNWDGPFPGGEDLWPQALRDPGRVAYEVLIAYPYLNLGTDSYISFVLSWEPI